VLLGKTVADNLFADEDPVGKLIRIRKVPFTVLGVLEPKGQSPMGQDQDDLIITPISTAKKKLIGGPQSSADAVASVMIEARDPASMKDAQSEIEALLRQRHRLAPGDDDDFTVRNLEELFTAQEASAEVMATLLASIASVSLIVGGIGIMNIMLVSVTERTKEIGLRMAVGAKTKNILAQFLVEAVTLAALGGAAGIGFGIASSMLISHFAGWTTHTSTGAILLAFVFSALVGVFFGYYPARKAALLNPIEALRHE
jgi:putative ABC transport system permease protein